MFYIKCDIIIYFDNKELLLVLCKILHNGFGSFQPNSSGVWNQSSKSSPIFYH